MANIELRWVKREVPTYYSPDPAQLQIVHMVRVLQFRQREGPGWWGRWQDVPEETAPEAGRE